MSRTTRVIGPVDLESEREALGGELLEALRRVLDSGHYILGPEVEEFERGFARRCRCAHAFGVASGTDALVLALLAAGIGPGDHVLTTPFTFFASVGSIAWIGAVPRLADVDPGTGLLDPRAVEQAVDGRTAALLPVHLYGQMADVRALRRIADEHGLALIEDGAQAHGAERAGIAPGELGDACTFSFYPTKNLGAAGEGGLVVTRRDDVAERLRGLRDHGSSVKYRHDFVGTNSRMHAFQGAILLAKLPHLDAWNARRRALASRYDEILADVRGVTPLRREDDAVHAYHQYTVRLEDAGRRDAVLAGLRERGVLAAVHYPTPVHLQPAAADWGYGEGSFPVAEALARSVVSLPVHPFLENGEPERVVEALASVLRGSAA